MNIWQKIITLVSSIIIGFILACILAYMDYNKVHNTL